MAFYIGKGHFMSVMHYRSWWLATQLLPICQRMLIQQLHLYRSMHPRRQAEDGSPALLHSTHFHWWLCLCQGRKRGA